ncbi:MAG: lamin tail domain-containing protein [Patescibacteria group bacterium]
MGREKQKHHNLSWLVVILIGIFFVWPITTYASPDYLVISQIQIAGTNDANDEFIELYNPTAASINLKSLPLKTRIRNSSGTDQNRALTFINEVIPAYGFFLIGPSSGYSGSVSLDATYSSSSGNKLVNNGGVYISNNTTAEVDVIDMVGWGTQPSGGYETSPYPENPPSNQSLERRRLTVDSRQDTNDNSQDFTLQTSTPHNSSSAPEISTDNPPPSPAPVYTMPLPVTPPPPSEPQVGEVVINEFVADPVDGGQEWVELYNRADRQIDLTNFTITEGSGAVTSLTGLLGTYEAGRYHVAYSPKGNLNNSGDIIILKYQDKIIDQVSYGSWDDGNKTDNAPQVSDPLSCGRIPNGTDTNNDAMDFVKTTSTPGTANNLPTVTETEETNTTAANKITGSLSFNELYPNPPLGDLEQEFIELINLSSEAIDLAGWKIFDDINQYIINPENFASTIIKPNDLFILPRQITKIALNNSTKEKISLTSPNGKTTFNINYSAPAPEGVAWTKNENDEWVWSTTVTRGQTNIITLINEPPIIYWELPDILTVGEPLIFDASDTVDPNGDDISFLWNFGDSTTAQYATPTHVYAKSGKYNLQLTAADPMGSTSQKKKTITIGNEANDDETDKQSSTSAKSISAATTYKFVTPEQIKNLASRTKVQTQGVVAIEPNIFGKSLFLAGSGIQLFLSTADSWPNLLPGDQIMVTGTVSQTKSYGARMLVKAGSDVTVINSVEPPEPINMELEELAPQHQGWFITTSGAVTRYDKTSLTLLVGDKTLKVNYKTEDTWPELTTNNQVTVTGFLVLTNGELRLWPRSADDIVIANEQPLGKVEGISNTIIDTEPTNWLGYMFIGLALMIIVIGWWWEKKHWPKPVELWQKIWRK